MEITENDGFMKYDVMNGDEKTLKTLKIHEI